MHATPRRAVRILVWSLLAASALLSPGCRRAPTTEAEDETILPATLEFRILANDRDDKDAIEAADWYFTVKVRADDKLRRELEELSLAGKPPPPPVPRNGDVFPTPVGRFTYRWVELGHSERLSLHLDQPAEPKSSTEASAGSEESSFLDQVSRARNKGELASIPRMGGCPLYSRPCNNDHLTEDERNKKAVEYFVLTRNPEEPEQAIPGNHLIKVYVAIDRLHRPALGFQLDQAGGDLFADLTGRNAPGEFGPHRYLAIILDDQVVSAPHLNAKISTEGIIEGNFTPAEVKSLVKMLRAGIAGNKK
jgi:hypothetical protein